MAMTKSELLKKLHDAKNEWNLARAKVDDEWYDLDIQLSRVLPLLDAIDNLDTKEKELVAVITAIEEELAKLKTEGE